MTVFAVAGLLAGIMTAQPYLHRVSQYRHLEAHGVRLSGVVVAAPAGKNSATLSVSFDGQERELKVPLAQPLSVAPGEVVPVLMASDASEGLLLPKQWPESSRLISLGMLAGWLVTILSCWPLWWLWCRQAERSSEGRVVVIEAATKNSFPRGWKITFSLNDGTDRSLVMSVFSGDHELRAGQEITVRGTVRKCLVVEADGNTMWGSVPTVSYPGKG